MADAEQERAATAVGQGRDGAGQVGRVGLGGLELGPLALAAGDQRAQLLLGHRIPSVAGRPPSAPPGLLRAALRWRFS